VADAPFLLVEAQWQEDGRLQLTTNLQQQFMVGAQYPVTLQAEPPTGQLLPYMQLPRGLSAKFSRALYYQLAEQAQRIQVADSEHYVLSSGAYQFRLG
jgi:hypothetical protein